MDGYIILTGCVVTQVWDSVNKQVVLNLNGAPHCLHSGSSTDSRGAPKSSCGFNLQMVSKDQGVSWGAGKYTQAVSL